MAPSTSVADAVSSSTVAELLNEAGGVAGPVAFWKEYHGGDFECCEMAETGGRLESDQGCLFIWHDEVTSRSLALWPFGTRWDDQTDELITPEGVTVETDAMFESGGGFHAIDMLDDFTTSPAVDSYLRRCAEVGPASLSEIAVVQGNYIVPVAP